MALDTHVSKKEYMVQLIAQEYRRNWGIVTSDILNIGWNSIFCTDWKQELEEQIKPVQSHSRHWLLARHLEGPQYLFSSQNVPTNKK